MIQNIRIQYPVGQGFFHGGFVCNSESLFQIPLIDYAYSELDFLSAYRVAGLYCSSGLPNSYSPFSYVYDCGSLSLNRLKKIVGNKSGNAKPVLNMLIISHFHYDHVSGIKHILDNFQVETVVIPFVSLTDRVMSFVMAKKPDPPGPDGNSSDPDSNDPDGNNPNFFSSFIANPELTLREFGVNRVIIFHSNSKDNDHEGGATNWPDLSPQYNRGEGEGRIVLDIDLFNGNGSNKNNVFKITDDHPLMLRSFRVPVWCFLFYVDESFGNEAEFIEALWSVRRENETVSLEKVKRDLNSPQWLGDRLKEDLTGRGGGVLRQAYDHMIKKLGKNDFNGTSLCAYSGPIPKLRPKTRYWYLMNQNENSLRVDPNYNVPGWLGTGDAILTNLPKTFKDRYRDVQKLTGSVTIPHHGSRENSDEKLIQWLKPRVAIISADPSNKKYKHPDSEICKMLVQESLNLQLVSQDPKSKFIELVGIEY